MAIASAKIAALQAALAVEQAASYGYGVVGAHLRGTAFTLAAADCVAHERARDSLAAMIMALGADPRPAAIVYRMPIAVKTARDAALLAADLENGVVAGYLSLVAVPEAALRRLAAVRMQAAAVRAARWGGAQQSFPGLAARR
ncbi:MAG TPA: DUF4439 domain-containing protein [Streptosporangiaceae bacterium]|nr:DUF4439 domain-containing protein [Streptosporangiaceae bacterium]